MRCWEGSWNIPCPWWGCAGCWPTITRRSTGICSSPARSYDLGKIRELCWDRVFEYTDVGRLLGHITLGVLLVEERIRAIPDFPADLANSLLHCILSHHGELEWGSPKRPKTLEAIVLHYAENLDGKINSFLNFSKRYPDPQHPGWTQFNKALDRYLYFASPAGEVAGEADAPVSS